MGKTFFWPTSLGIVSEQSPRGGALTLNAIAGIGMLTVGIIGGPLIGHMQEKSAENAIPQALYQKVSSERSYVLGKYNAVDADKVAALTEAEAQEVRSTEQAAKQSALRTISIFPFIMLLSYIGLLLYFKSRGGYQAVHLASEEDVKPTKEGADEY